jgi:probable rRNA maturation factor
VSNELSVSKEPRARKVDLRLLQRATKRALTLLDVDYVLGIRVVGSREMARVNEAYLSHTGPTDVITFHYQKAAVRSSAADSQDKRQIYGDILICSDVAEQQAAEFRTSVAHELVRYSVHGVLHLLGFDDRTAAARAKMKKLEDKLMRQLTRELNIGASSAKARHG